MISLINTIINLLSGTINSTTKRLLNKHTLSGLTIVIMWLENQNILPKDSYQVLGVIKSNDILIYLPLILGFYFIIKMPDFIDEVSNSAVLRAKNRAEIAEFKYKEKEFILKKESLNKKPPKNGG